jgi:hypothetical protein
VIHTSALTNNQSTQVQCIAPALSWNSRYFIVAHKQAFLELVEAQCQGKCAPHPSVQAAVQMFRCNFQRLATGEESGCKLASVNLCDNTLPPRISARSRQKRRAIEPLREQQSGLPRAGASYGEGIMTFPWMSVLASRAVDASFLGPPSSNPLQADNGGKHLSLGCGSDQLTIKIGGVSHKWIRNLLSTRNDVILRRLRTSFCQHCRPRTKQADTWALGAAATQTGPWRALGASPGAGATTCLATIATASWGGYRGGCGE